MEIYCSYYWRLVEIALLALGVNVYVLVGNVLTIRRQKKSNE